VTAPAAPPKPKRIRPIQSGAPSTFQTGAPSTFQNFFGLNTGPHPMQPLQPGQAAPPRPPGVPGVPRPPGNVGRSASVPPTPGFFPQ
jgi:hypothetical protein